MRKSSQIFLAVLAFLISMVFFSNIANSEVQLDTDNLSNDSLLEQNIVIVIDSSPSMLGQSITGYKSGQFEPIYGPSFIDLSRANALIIIQNIGHCGYAGVATFGVVINKTEIVSMDDKANKAELEEYIKNIVPINAKKYENLDKGLVVAEELLNQVNGRKEITASACKF